MLGGGTAPTAHLLVTTPCNSPAGPPSVSGYYPWIDVFMVDRNRDCGADGGNGLVEVSIPLPDRAHLFEACKTYTVVINKKRVHALAVDGAALCPPETSDPSPEEAPADGSDQTVGADDPHDLRLLRLLAGVVGRVEAVPLAQGLQPG